MINNYKKLNKYVPKSDIPKHWLIPDLYGSHKEKFLPYDGSEDAFQICFASYMRTMFPDILYFHVANERDLSSHTRVTVAGRIVNRAGGKLYAKGVLSGVPDNIIIPWKTVIELKVANRRLTKNQFSVMERFDKDGWKVFVTWSMDEARWLLSKLEKMK